MNKYSRLFLIIVYSCLCNLIANAQYYDATFKVRELKKGTGANVAGCIISLYDAVNEIQYLGQTDANGVLLIPQIKAGTYMLKTNKNGFIGFSKKSFIINGNKQINVCLKKKQSDGPWGSYEFDVAFFQATAPEIFGEGGRDCPHFDHILPIYMRIDGATQADLDLITARRDSTHKKTGYNLLQIVDNSVSKDTTYTMYVNSNTNTSATGTDINGVMYAAASKITGTDPSKKIDHEEWHIFGKRPGQYSKATISDDLLSTMPDYPQVWDYGDVAAIFDQNFAVNRGEQNTFNMSEMKEFVADVLPNGTTILLPLNNATGVSSSLEFKTRIDTLARKYHLQISTNSSFTDIVFDKDIFRNDTTINNLPPTTQLYARENVSNSVGTTAWSPTITFTTGTITSIKDNFLDQPLKIYPTICSSLLTIEIIPQKLAEYSIETMSLTGDPILRQSGKTSLPLTLTSNVSGLVPGLYFVKVTLKYTDSEFIKTFRIIKQ